MPHSLQPHVLQHARLLCPSLSPRVCSDSCPLSRWCYLSTSFSAAPFSFRLLSFLTSGSVPLIDSLHQVPKVLEHQLQHSSSNEYSGLISFRIDWFDLLAVQWTLRSLLQHHNSKASILWLSAFFMVQLSHLYMTTGKIIVYSGDSADFVSKVMSLLILSSFVIDFLQRSKHLLISWL